MSSRKFEWIPILISNGHGNKLIFLNLDVKNLLLRYSASCHDLSGCWIVYHSLHCRIIILRHIQPVGRSSSWDINRKIIIDLSIHLNLLKGCILSSRYCSIETSSVTFSSIASHYNCLVIRYASLRVLMLGEARLTLAVLELFSERELVIVRKLDHWLICSGCLESHKRILVWGRSLVKRGMLMLLVLGKAAHYWMRMCWSVEGLFHLSSDTI